MSELRIAKLCYHGIGPFDFILAPAQCTCLTGASGTGKSLMLRAITDLDPHEGEIFLDSETCADMPAPAWRRQVGLLAAETYWWHDSVGEHFPDAEATETPDLRWIGYLECLGFEPDVVHWTVQRLSSGERQRLALVRLLKNHPKVLLLDEPTANLDSESTRRVEALIKRYQEENQAPVLWVTHNRAQIERVADRHLSISDATLAEIPVIYRK
ncbi:MAG: ATP-binding cassette domain-containing protein [Gammaproteobacteria bacterium]|nr:ATP-binding cassette domain-containing protein [Gammaproteobacteria bacterium]